MTLDWRRAVGIDPNPGRAAEVVEAWREEVWRLLRTSQGRDLHREVLCGRMALADAADELVLRGIPIGNPRALD